jgi:cytochrome c5
MAPAIGFYAGSDFAINDLAGSGLGFYGSGGFGASVLVSEWQGRTFITNSAGTAQGPEVDNCKYLNPTGVILGQAGSGIKLNQIPNYLATLNVRFTNDVPVKTQNVVVRTYDRSNIANPASGVTVAAYEVVHTGTGQTADGSGGPGTPTVSGQHGWVTMAATGMTTMALTASPGTSGLRPSGSNTTDTRHDWYLALSASPDSIGSKLFAGYVSLEFL